MRHQIFERTLHPSGYACFSVLNTPHAPSGRVVVGPSPAPSDGRRRLKSGVQSSPSSPVRPGGSGATAGPEPHTGAPTLARFTGVRAAWRSFAVAILWIARFYPKFGPGALSFQTKTLSPGYRRSFFPSNRSLRLMVWWIGRGAQAQRPVLLQARHDDDAQLRESAGQPGRTRVIQRGARASRTQRKRSPTQQESRQRASARARPPNESSRDPRVDGTDQLNPSSPNREETRERANRARQPHYHFTMGPEIKQEDPLDLSI